MPIRKTAALLALLLSKLFQSQGDLEIQLTNNQDIVPENATSSLKNILKLLSSKEVQEQKVSDFFKPTNPSLPIIFFQKLPLTSQNTEMTVGELLANEELVRKIVEHFSKDRRLQASFTSVESLVEAAKTTASPAVYDTVDCLLNSEQPNQALRQFQNSLFAERSNENIKNYCTILLQAIASNDPANWFDFGFDENALANFTSALHIITSPETSLSTTITLPPVPTNSAETTSSSATATQTTTQTQEPTTLTITTTPTTFGYFANTTTSDNPNANTITFTDTTTVTTTTCTLTTDSTTGVTTATITTGTFPETGVTTATTTGTSFEWHPTTLKWSSTSATDTTPSPFIPLNTTPPTFFVPTTTVDLSSENNSTTSEPGHKTTEQPSQFNVTATTTDGTTTYQVTNTTTNTTQTFTSTNGADPQPLPNQAETGNDANTQIAGGVGGGIGAAALFAAVAFAVHRINRNRQQQGTQGEPQTAGGGDLEQGYPPSGNPAGAGASPVSRENSQGSKDSNLNL